MSFPSYRKLTLKMPSQHGFIVLPWQRLNLLRSNHKEATLFALYKRFNNRFLVLEIVVEIAKALTTFFRNITQL